MSEKCPNCLRYIDPIGHEIRGVYDGVLFWCCPECGHAWPRWFAGEGRLKNAARAYCAQRNNSHCAHCGKPAPHPVTEPMQEAWLPGGSPVYCSPECVSAEAEARDQL